MSVECYTVPRLNIWGTLPSYVTPLPTPVERILSGIADSDTKRIIVPENPQYFDYVDYTGEVLKELLLTYAVEPGAGGGTLNPTKIRDLDNDYLLRLFKYRFYNYITIGDEAFSVAGDQFDTGVWSLGPAMLTSVLARAIMAENANVIMADRKFVYRHARTVFEHANWQISQIIAKNPIAEFTPRLILGVVTHTYAITPQLTETTDVVYFDDVTARLYLNRDWTLPQLHAWWLNNGKGAAMPAL